MNKFWTTSAKERVVEHAVPLFDCDSNKYVIGRKNKREVLSRTSAMEHVVIQQTEV